MVQMGEWVWMEGDWVPFAQSSVSIVTHSLHYGLAAFDGLRAYKTAKGPAIFRLPEHARRFVNSCKVAEMPIRFDQAAIEAAHVEAIKRNKHEACYLRPLAWYGHEKVGLNTQGMTAKCALMTWEWGAYLGDEGLENGIRCVTSSYTRHHPNISLTRAKISGNYVNSQIAKAEAVENGYDEALMLDPEGYVVEGTGENLFVVEGNDLVTPPKGSILPGITRSTIMTLAKAEGMKVREERIDRGRLYLADEVFLTGTAAEVTPVREIDRKAIGIGKAGDRTKTLQKMYFKVVRGELPEYMDWLTVVPLD